MKYILVRSRNFKVWMLAWLLVLANGLLVRAMPQASRPTQPNVDMMVGNLSTPQTLIDDEPMAQVTSVSQLKDVQPKDWAFQALQTLVERYDCIAGYPDGTYRGNRALSRWEFAAGLNTCMESISQVLGAAEVEQSKREDLITLQKLQAEFAPELATLRGRVDNLEAHTAEIQANRFSTTTKLSAVAIVGVQGRNHNRADVSPRDGNPDTDDPGRNINVISLAQLYLTTQFNPRSYLLTGLLTGDGSTAPKSSNDIVLGYEFPTDKKFIISDLNYHWLATDNLAIMVGTAGVNMTTAFRGPNRVESAATGPLSYFAQRNPILDIGYGQGGIAVDWQFTKRASLQALYSSYNSGNPGKRSGLFDGNTTTAVQLLLTPTDSLDVSLYYANNYSVNGCLLTFIGDECLTAVDANVGKSAPLQTNAVGATVNWQISQNITLGAWGGYTNSHIPGRLGSVETTNYMVYLNFPDLFKKGNLGGIYIGQPPKIISSNLPVGNNVPDINTGLGRAGGQPGTTTHVEAFYRLQLTDNISITPGLIYLLEPGHTPDSDPVTIGILRSTFFF